MIGELLKPSEVSEQSDTNMLYKPQIQFQRKRKLPKHERSPCLYIVIQGKTHPVSYVRGFPCGSAGKESACSAGDLGWENPLKNRKATQSSILAWRIPRTV